MQLSDHLEDALLDAVLRGVTYTSPANVYVALFTTATGDDGSGTEVTGGSYARQQITFALPDSGQVVSDTDADFIDMPACVITHLALVDALTGGNFLFHGPLLESRAVTTGETVTVTAGALSCSLD